MISSSKGVVKRGKEIPAVWKYVPPEQTSLRPEKSKKESKAVEEKEGGSAEQEAAACVDPVPEVSFQEELLSEAQAEAEEIRQEAERLAEQLRDEAKEEIEEQRKEAAEQGYQEGYARGLEEGRQKAIEEYGARLKEQLEGFQRDMERALASAEEAKEKSLNKYLDELKDCAIAVGEKVIHISLKSSGDVIKRMILAETEKLKKTAWVKIYMERTDYETMMKGDADMIGELSRLSDNVKFVVMNKDKSGRCIIEMPDQVVDVSVDTQLENIREVLENIR